MPPNDTAGHACDSYNQFLRANFSPRQIGMLFGYQTSYAENLTGAIGRLHQRYQVLLQQFLAEQSAANANATVAARQASRSRFPNASTWTPRSAGRLFAVDHA